MVYGYASSNVLRYHILVNFRWYFWGCSFYGDLILSKALGLVIDIIRNLPLLLIIFFTYFALPQLGIRLNIFWAAVGP